MLNAPKTREEWLLLLAEQIVPHIETHAAIAFPKYRVSCSWPLKGGLARNGRVRGQCWAATASTDNHAEIFVSPYEDDPREVAVILAHELIHAALPDAGHGPDFKHAAMAIGFKPPMRSANLTEQFWAWVEPVLANLPPYPHKSLNPLRVVLKAQGDSSGPQEGEEPTVPVGMAPPQKNRQMKCTCSKCGYIARTSRKWIDLSGPPICPVEGHGVMDMDF